MSFLKKIPSWTKNKYMLTLAGFIVWLLFFDHNDFFTQVERRSELRQINKGKAYYSSQIEEIKKASSTILESPERAAREKYMMKKDNEDLFIIEENE
ncbi:MAG: septum formation initiator family protein [Chitinophagaceae bacterium]|nr:septum formation initiator family protein [Chitinophagaceae bacterium]